LKSSVDYPQLAACNIPGSGFNQIALSRGRDRLKSKPAFEAKKQSDAVGRFVGR
jgi:hypothetical protein